MGWGRRGKGQLTQNAIRKLTIYYNRAIRGSNSVDSMKKAVVASLHHCFSTDDRPHHELCHTGMDSWCFFEEALAKHQVPGPHDKLVHTPLNEKKLTRLSEDQLLSRCVSGKTQNDLGSLCQGPFCFPQACPVCRRHCYQRV